MDDQTSTPADDNLAITAVELYRMSTAVPLDEYAEQTLAAMLRRGVDGLWAQRRFDLAGSTRAVLAARALVSLYLFDENVAWSVSHPALRRDALAYLRDLIDGTQLRLGVKGYRVANGEERIEMDRGNWLRITARSNHGGRGLSADCLIVEDYRYGDDLAEVAPVIAARRNGQMIVAYRPARAS
jgi:hypothetical protein